MDPLLGDSPRKGVPLCVDPGSVFGKLTDAKTVRAEWHCRWEGARLSARTESLRAWVGACGEGLMLTQTWANGKLGLWVRRPVPIFRPGEAVPGAVCNLNQGRSHVFSQMLRVWVESI